MLVYLNNTGHRWTDTVRSNRRFVLVLPDGTSRLRHASCYEAFGNFAVTVYKYRDVTYRAFAKASDGSETWLGTETGLDALPHVFHETAAISRR